MHTTLQLMVDGLAMGMVYVFMASGFNLIMSVPRILFIAFGQFYVLGAFITWYVTISGGQNFFLGVLAGTVASGLLGALVPEQSRRVVRSGPGAAGHRDHAQATPPAANDSMSTRR